MLDLNANANKKWSWLPHPVISLAVLVSWLLLTSYSPGSLIMGIILGWFIPWITQGFWIMPVKIKSWPKLAGYCLLVLYDIIIANIQTARLVLADIDKLQPSFIKLPLDLENPVAITMLANTITLTPGTISARVSTDCKHILVHGLNIHDPEQAIHEMKNRYEKPLKEIF